MALLKAIHRLFDDGPALHDPVLRRVVGAPLVMRRQAHDLAHVVLTQTLGALGLISRVAVDPK